MKRFVMMALAAGFIVAPARAAVETKYDKFKNLTTTSMPNVEVGFGLKITALFSHQGETLPGEMPQIAVGFINKRPTWEFMDACYGKGCSLIAIADGERLDLGRTDWDGTLGEGYVLEFMWASLPRATFQKIAMAKSVEMQLQFREFSLSEDARQSLRDLYEVSSPAGARQYAARIESQKPTTEVQPAEVAATSAESRPAAKPSFIAPIPPGMSMSSIQDVLGKPAKIEDVTSENGPAQEWTYPNLGMVFSFDKKSKSLVSARPIS